MDERESLDDVDQQIVDWVREFCQTNGCGPTDAEGAERFGWGSGWAFGYRVKKLVKKGYLWRDDAHRSLRTVDGVQTGLVLPLHGLVAAGEPIANPTPTTEYFSFNEAFGGAGNFMLEVRGSSMVDACIADGDFLILRPASTAEEGETVVCRIEDSLTVKVFRKIRGVYWLYPENKQMGLLPIRLDALRDNQIIGVLVGVARKGCVRKRP